MSRDQLLKVWDFIEHSKLYVGIVSALCIFGSRGWIPRNPDPLVAKCHRSVQDICRLMETDPESWFLINTTKGFDKSGWGMVYGTYIVKHIGTDNMFSRALSVELEINGKTLELYKNDRSALSICAHKWVDVMSADHLARKKD